MNITTRSTGFPTWISRKANHLVAAVGLAIALGAFGVLATVGDKEAPATPAPLTSTGSSLTPAAATAKITYYLVDTQEEADALTLRVQEQRMSAMVEGGEIDWGEHVFIAIDSPEREELAALMIQDLNGIALTTESPTATVVDLRVP